MDDAVFQIHGRWSNSSQRMKGRIVLEEQVGRKSPNADLARMANEHLQGR
jgi:hypothetical protein